MTCIASCGALASFALAARRVAHARRRRGADRDGVADAGARDGARVASSWKDGSPDRTASGSPPTTSSSQLKRIGARPLPGQKDYRLPFEFTAGTRDGGSTP